MSEAVDVSAPTDVFSADSDGRTVAFYTARRRRAGSSAASTRAHAADVVGTLADLTERGWRLSVAEMFGDVTAAAVYLSGPLHDADIVGAFEAPSLAEAERGVTALEAAGWAELFTTSWLLGPREFQPVPSPLGRDLSHEWCFFALWEWNEAWQQASAAERRDYDLECDEAFSFDIRSGVSIAGRHRLDWASPWHHLGIWEVASPEVVDRAMQMHERVADFRFTTSRHYLGRRRSFIDYLGDLI
jgi:hypothetical protein